MAPPKPLGGAYKRCRKFCVNTMTESKEISEIVRTLNQLKQQVKVLQEEMERQNIRVLQRLDKIDEQL